jgi:hypothetical protein
MMVQANQFCGLLSEDTSAHLQHFLSKQGSSRHMGQMFRDVPREVFPMGKTSALWEKNSNF